MIQLRVGTMRRWSVLLAFALATSVCVADDNREDVKQSAGVEKTSKELQHKIESEIGTFTNRLWAGSYYCGDGTGFNFRLAVAPTSGFVFQKTGCAGLWDRNYGQVVGSNGCIHLLCALKNERHGFEGIEEFLVPVPWGRRTYLVAPNEMIDFCNSVNDGSEPRTTNWGTHLLRVGDWDTKVTGLPVVPLEFRGYLLQRPVIATVISVDHESLSSEDNSETSTTQLTIDKGRKDGLLPEMVLHVTGEPDKNADMLDVRLTDVGVSTCSAIVVQTHGKYYSKVKRGWKLSTRFDWITPTK